MAGRQFVHVATCYPLPRTVSFGSELLQLYVDTLKPAIFEDDLGASEEKLSALSSAALQCINFWLEGYPISGEVRELLQRSTALSPVPEFSEVIED
ncbi:MAG TPA: hypothetical protein VNG90_05275 [Candidatus Acidoferrum sp.]|nr:hypothetical protein [Candidatus Acidoferrum sp.]